MPPEFRCLLCDLVLADEGTPGTRKCDQCGKFVLNEQPVESQPLMNLSTVAPPPIPDTPPPIPTVAPRGYLPRPNSSSPVDLASLPEAVVSRPVPSFLPPPPAESKLVPFNPNFVPDPQRPEPQMFKALFVLFLMVIAGIIATTIIGYAIARGLKKAKKVAAVNDNLVQTTPTTSGTPLTPGTTKPTPAQPRITGPSIWAPATSTFSVIPAKLPEPRTIQLPSTATEGIYAGNARFILWHMPRIEMVAVWDTSKLAFHGYLPAPGVRSHIAATANRAFVVSTDRGTITSYKLADLAQEKTQTIAENLGKPVAAVAGHMSDGPLFVMVNKDRAHRLSIVDPATLEPRNWKSVVLPQKQSGSPFMGSLGDRSFLRCSANGKNVIAGVATGQKDFDVDTAELFGEELLIAPVGKSIHPIGLTAEGRPMIDGRPGVRFPMSIGSGYFTTTGKPGRAVLDFSSDVFIQRGELEAEGFQNRLDVDDESPRDRWAFLTLAARVLVYLGDDRKELKVVPVDIDKSMTGTKLLIRSAPPQFAFPGQKWTYDLRTLPQGSTRIQLDSAPENMTVEAGKLSWTVPADTNLSEAKVELTVTSDLDDKSVARQSFSIAIRPKPFAVNILEVPNIPEPRIAELQADRGSELQFTSKPVSKVKPGDEYRLAVKITSGTDKAKVALLQAPEAMKWDGESLVWKVPATQPEGYYPVVLQTESKFQAFNIWVTKD